MGNDEDFEEGEEKTKASNPSTVASHHHSVCPPRERVGEGGEGWLGQREMVTMLELEARRRRDEESSSTLGEGEKEESIIARRR
uniref:Uncharacterized protein n=1 Tax=Oryza barthii TaxID=65489 RepID=A0A0D3FDK5_9ORYZ